MTVFERTLKALLQLIWAEREEEGFTFQLTSLAGKEASWSKK
jgi:hypothetical protein